MLAIPGLAVSLAFYPLIVSGFSFSIDNTPQQCQNLSISITGSGQPPYNAVILPFGPTPLSNNTEVRKILYLPFSGNSTSLSFQLTYPENSQFVVVVSDSSGFGTGGTSTAAEVQTGSSDSSCYGNTQVSPAFSFSTDPANQLVQCSPIRIWWDPTTTQGNVQFYAVIPGGQSIQLNQGTLTTVANEGLGFSWGVPVRVGTTVLLAGGDGRGIGSAGSIQQNVQQGESTINNTCLDASSPSSTPGSPAGGMYPTATSSSGTGGKGKGGGGGDNGENGGSGSKSNIGAIVGGVVGGLVALVAILLACFFFLRRRRIREQGKTHTTVDLFHGDQEDGAPNGGDLPQFYQPEPFLVADPSVPFLDPDPTVASSHGDSFERARRQSATSTDFLRSGTPDPQGLGGVGSTGGSAQTRKSRMGPAQLRPVNIIQHDDGGDADEGDQTQETIELPPAYTHIRKPRATTTTTTDDDNANNEATLSSST